MVRFIFALIVLILGLPHAAWGDHADRGRELVDAARQGDIDKVNELLAAGVDVNARGKFGITALWQAASRGHDQLLTLLVERGADVNVPDDIWHATPLMLTGNEECVALLIRHGAAGADAKLREAAMGGEEKLVQAILATEEFTPHVLALARAHAELGNHASIIQLLEEAASEPLPKPPLIPESTLLTYAGRYLDERMQEAEVSTRDGQLFIELEAGRQRQVIPVDQQTFALGDTRYRFETSEGRVTAFLMEDPFSSSRYVPRTSVLEESVSDTQASSFSLRDDRAILAGDRWPSFRGIQARGLAVDQNLPEKWDVEEDRNVQWRIPLAGLGNSCPIVWDDRVFVTTAISEAGQDDLRIGLYGAITAVDDQSAHTWQLLCLDRRSGQLRWERTVHEGIPPVKRHLKSTQANPTPATDGEHVVALFNFGGLYCYDFEGKLLWNRDLGVLDSGAFHDRDFQWGFGSSPIIYRDLVIVQCDIQQDSFVAAYGIQSGEEIWRQPRDEVPSWATPTVFETAQGPLLTTSGTNFARGYDALSGQERWRLSGNAAITVPTPQVAHDLVYITSGYRPIQPIFAVRPDALGDISLASDQSLNRGIAWSKDRGGPYLPTPLIYGGFFYTCANNGVLACYAATTGQQIYRKRASRGAATSFTASPVAADGKIYLTAESGDVIVVKAGPQFEVLAENPLGETCLATPAIAGGMFLARTHKHLVAVGMSKSE